MENFDLSFDLVVVSHLPLFHYNLCIFFHSTAYLIIIKMEFYKFMNLISIFCTLYFSFSLILPISEDLSNAAVTLDCVLFFSQVLTDSVVLLLLLILRAISVLLSLIHST